MTPEQTSELFALLMRQEELLKQLVASINKPKLGLHSEAGSCKIYCNRQHGGLWYKLNGEPSAIPQTALTGYLKELRFENNRTPQKRNLQVANNYSSRPDVYLRIRLRYAFLKVHTCGDRNFDPRTIVFSHHTTAAARDDR
ncbi:hypothetical protein LC612_16970 [Nostoc sp. CHAB 5834]|nr:hypothetical protein [Nostoc sp. CHAB 5834]